MDISVPSIGPTPLIFKPITIPRIEQFTNNEIGSKIYSGGYQPAILHFKATHRIPFLEARAYFSKAKTESSPKTLPINTGYQDNEPCNIVGTLKYPIRFGPLWSTHWLCIQLKDSPSNPEVPLADNHEKLFSFDAKCEACVYDEAGCPIQGLTGSNLGFSGNDCPRQYVPLSSIDFQTTNCFYVEIAVNGLFGVSAEDKIAKRNQNDMTGLLQTCKIVHRDPDYFNIFLKLKFMTQAAKDMDSHLGGGNLLLFLNDIVNKTDANNGESVAQSLALINARLDRIKNPKSNIQPFNLHFTGHCHIDSCWLWPKSETVRKVARSWASQIDLINNFSNDYIFCASQAVQYDWVKRYYPLLWTKILTAVKQGRFFPIGGTWVEPDLNMPSGEGLMRQFLLGQSFFKKHFGIFSTCFFAPDSFGYSAALPSIISECGASALITQKLSWNRYNKPANTSFVWEGIGGHKILVHFPPADTYTAEADFESINNSWKNHKDYLRGSQTALELFGFGDGGGGPTLEMIKGIEIFSQLDSLPSLKFENPVTTLQQISAEIDGKSHCHVGELFFEYHIGVTISQANTKKFNRKLELLAIQAETLATWAKLNQAECVETWTRDITEAWKTICFNHFHDILPGSSIKQVYDDAMVDYIIAWNKLMNIIGTASSHLAFSFNSKSENSIDVTSTVSNTVPGIFWPTFINQDKTETELFDTIDLTHTQLNELVGPYLLQPPTLNLTSTTCANTTSVPFSNILVNLKPGSSSKEPLLSSLGMIPYIPPSSIGTYTPITSIQECVDISGDSCFGVETEDIISYGTSKISVQLVKKTGHLTISQNGTIIIDKGLVCNLWDDHPSSIWVAWDLDSYYSQKLKQSFSPVSINLIESSPLRVTVELTFKISKVCIFKVSSTVSIGSPVVRFDCHLQNWATEPCLKQNLLSLDFQSTLLESTDSLWEVPYGFISRSTHDNTAHDFSRFHCPMYRWATLIQGRGSGQRGVAIINDSKYGMAIRRNHMRLSCIRSTTYPDPCADHGDHRFSFAVMPHFDLLPVIHESRRFNSPPISIMQPELPVAHPPPPPRQFYRVDNPSILIEICKLPEPDLINPKRPSNEFDFILRCIQVTGVPSTGILSFGDFQDLTKSTHNSNIDSNSTSNTPKIKRKFKVARLSGIEQFVREIPPCTDSCDSFKLSLSPFEIFTIGAKFI